MFGREMKKVIIDIQGTETEHYIDAYGSVSALSQAMQQQGIEKCCRATVESMDGDRELFIEVRNVATIGVKASARGKI